MNRRLIAALILTSILYFPLGWLAVQLSVLPRETYFSIAAIVGGLASIVGLVAFIRPPLSRADVKNIEWESIEEAAKAAKEVEELESRKVAAHSELDELTRTKEEMEILVKKASLALFLREEQKRIEEEIVPVVAKDKALVAALRQHREYRARIQELDKEIEAHPDAELLSEIVFRARVRERELLADILRQVRKIPFYGPFLESFLRVTIVLFESVTRALMVILEGRK
ncbi:hypothetical protein [Candidatus Thiosymbion oneisti]|uniref:hypothetical protein n=1 Tax=Candidatus Thiosymbion oneisti TaxID=589554 RepID=UPI000B7F8A0B|nr:hypothetical protein [Candidatus Thiosymbion oneisti]